jgi:hypothetical protein
VPILAAGLLALFRYSFGSLFVVGESVAEALLHSTGADIAGTMQRLQNDPWRGMAHAALGLALSLGAAGLAFRRAALAMGLAAASGTCALTFGMTVPAALLGAGLVCGTVGLITPRP